MDYLTELERHADDARADPQNWLPSVCVRMPADIEWSNAAACLGRPGCRAS